MAERGIAVDHSTVHRWAIKLLPELEKAFRRCKRAVGKSWRMDESVSRTQAKACGAVLKMGVGLPESACRSRLQCVTNAGASLRCCTRDGSRPPEIGLQEQISNRPVRLHPKDVVVSDWGKGVLIGRQVRIEKMSASEPSDDAPLALKYCQNRGRGAAPGSVGTTPAYGPDGSRCIGGMSSIQALVW